MQGLLEGPLLPPCCNSWTQGGCTPQRWHSSTRNRTMISLHAQTLLHCYMYETLLSQQAATCVHGLCSVGVLQSISLHQEP